VGRRNEYLVTVTAREENDEFCVTVAPATRTAGIVTQLVKGASCQIEPPIRLIWAILGVALAGSNG